MDLIAAGGLVKIVQAGGVLAVLCLVIVFVAGLWRSERSERQKLQEQLLARSEEQVRAIVQAEVAARQLRELLLQRGVISQWEDPPGTGERRLPPSGSS